MIDVELRLFLLSRPGVSDLVSSRIYPALLPEDEVLPAIVLLQLSDTPSYSNSGICHTRPRYQVDSYAGTLSMARQVDENVRAILSGFTGKMGQYRATVFLANTSNYRLNDEEFWRVSSDYLIHLIG